MEFLRIYNADDSCTRQILDAYLETFPAEERREKDQFLALFENPNAQILSLKKDGESVGYLILWQLSECVFVEHFEVFLEHRNRKLGSEILQDLQKIYPKIILESEPATLNEIADRRINFYQRNGFNVIDEHYLQPAYGEGKNFVNLWLLANYIPKDTDALVREIYNIVYAY